MAQGNKAVTTTTQAQAKGFVVNVTRLKLAGNDGSYNNLESRKNKVWILVDDDGSSCPYFDAEDGSETTFCAYVRDMEIIQEVPAPAPAPSPRPAQFVTVNVEVTPPGRYTDLQQLAINTFQGMYDAAVRHRNGEPSNLHSTYGICDNIERFSDLASANSYHMVELKENLIRLTDIYSGNYTYPVPAADGGDAGNAFSNVHDKWEGAYGLNRLTQLGQLIEIIKSDKWNDDLIKRKTPAVRNGLEVGDLIQYTRRGDNSLWVFRRDDDSTSPSFHKLGNPDDYTDLDLTYVVKVDRNKVLVQRPVGEFLSVIAEKTQQKADIERQIAELQKQLKENQTEIAILDFGLADQHKVKRIN